MAFTDWWNKPGMRDEDRWVKHALSVMTDPTHVQVHVWGSDWTQPYKRNGIIDGVKLLAKERKATVSVMRDPNCTSQVGNTLPSMLGAVGPDGNVTIPFFGA